MPIVCCGCQRSDKIRMYGCRCMCHSNNFFPDFEGTLPGMGRANSAENLMAQSSFSMNFSDSFQNHSRISQGLGSFDPTISFSPLSRYPSPGISSSPMQAISASPTLPRADHVQSPFVPHNSFDRIPSPNPIVVRDPSFSPLGSVNSPTVSNASFVAIESPYSVIPSPNIPSPQNFVRGRKYD